MSDILRELFDNDLWANARIMVCLRSEPERNHKALRFLGHLLSAEAIWLARLQRKDTSAVDKFPALSLDECEELAARNQKGYFEFLNSMDDQGLDSLVTYRNFAGSEFRTRVRDILMHVALHGTYHRGQISLTVRGPGFEPVDTDFTTFVGQPREG